MATTEERLAALEAKLAQLTATTPTEYYTHQYSGEEIDAAVGRAVAGGTLDTSVTNIGNQLGTFVRPNLLDNWYFGRPVNQRGQAEYTVGYGIDRWYILNTNKMSVQSDCVIFTYVDNNYGVWERLENLVSGTYTLSLLFKDGTLITNTKAIDVSQASYVFDTPRYNGWNVQLHDDKTVRITCIGNSGDTAAILAVKLELGPTQTLAHQENGVWVLNEVPEYGEQLRRCQRYYIKYNTINANGYISNAAKSYYMPIFLPEALRTTPTILGTPKIRVRFNGGYSSKFVGGTFTAPDSWGVTVISANAVTLAFNVNTAVDPNNIPVSIEVEGLELSADL